MAREKEIKIKLVGVSLSEFIAKVNSQGFVLHTTIHQQDNYFDTPDWSLYKHLAALRLRILDDKDHSFSFKKVLATPNKRDPYYIEEIEIPAPFTNSTSLSEIFSRLGIKYGQQLFTSTVQLSEFLASANFISEQQMTKTRQIFVKGSDEIIIDDVVQVGVIIETECGVSEPLDLVKTLLKDPEWNRDLEGTSYLWLKNVKGFTDHIRNFARFTSEPDWNVLPSERQLYKSILNS